MVSKSSACCLILIGSANIFFQILLMSCINGLSWSYIIINRKASRMIGSNESLSEVGMQFDLNLMPQLGLELNQQPAVDQSFPSLTANELQLTNPPSSQNQSSTHPLSVQTTPSEGWIISFDNFLQELRSSHFSLKKRPQKSQLKLKFVRKRCRCVICQQSIKEKSVVHRLHCKHTFHRQCLTKWCQIKNTCPLCRTSLH